MDAGGKPEAASHDSFLNSAIITQCQFSILCRVDVDNCLELADLTWLVLAPNLEFLRLIGCLKLEQVVCAEKLCEMANNVEPFAKLEELIL
uniref:Uncharacterized protein n=1 Tax=Rhizophora mucronata TaxID=61149 RepID=A0A2P2ISM6_RHIMU